MVLGVDTEPEIGQFRDLVAAKQHVFQFDVTVGHVDAKYEIPNGTDIIQQSQSNIYRNPSERGKQKKKELTYASTHWRGSIVERSAELRFPSISFLI